MFQLDQRSKDLRTTSTPYTPPDNGRPARVVRNLKRINRRQRLQVHRPPSDAITYKALTPLHELWERYAAQVTLADVPQELDLHGAEVAVVASTMASLVGCTVRDV